MADETKTTGIFGANRRNPNDAPRDGQGAQSPAPTSDEQTNALEGQGGPNLKPAFAKRDGSVDENVQVTDDKVIKEAKEGAQASSAPSLDLIGVEAVMAAGGEVPEGHEDTVQYTSTPIAALRIGPYQFENGVLRVKKGDEEEKFEKLLKGASIRTQQVIRKIDRSAGEAVARRYLKQNQGTRTSGVDTSDRGPRAPSPADAQPAE